VRINQRLDQTAAKVHVYSHHSSSYSAPKKTNSKLIELNVYSDVESRITSNFFGSFKHLFFRSKFRSKSRRALCRHLIFEIFYNFGAGRFTAISEGKQESKNIGLLVLLSDYVANNGFLKTNWLSEARGKFVNVNVGVKL